MGAAEGSNVGTADGRGVGRLVGFDEGAAVVVTVVVPVDVAVLNCRQLNWPTAAGSTILSFRMRAMPAQSESALITNAPDTSHVIL